MKNKPVYIIDFDSTFTQVEGLDILAEISLRGRNDKAERLKKIKNITNQGMEGESELRKSLDDRLALIEANRYHLDLLVKRLKKKISKSFRRNEAFLKENSEQILIISNGFKEFIQPIVEPFGIPSKNIFANEFLYDKKGNITGLDTKSFLSANNGKAQQIKALGLKGPVYVIGDGYTDFEIKKLGLADKFFAFTENVNRKAVTSNADHITPSLDEFLYKQKLPGALSYPKNRIKVLLLENIHNEAIKKFKEEGYQVERVKGALTEEELMKAIKDVTLLCIRSKTHVTKRVLKEAKKLYAIGAFCIGTNQIDLSFSLEKGIAVFNAPYSNTRSVVELALAEIIFLMRKIPEKMKEMAMGNWKKTAEKSNEIRGKTLGILGYGNIGSQLGVFAESLGMEVVFYDLEAKMPLGNAKPMNSMNELFQVSDAISIHVDGREKNLNLIGKDQLGLMKKDSILVNLSRGHVVNIDDVVQSLEVGRLKGFSADVFPVEPKTNKEKFESSLRKFENVVLTPHIGGSTQEAQSKIAHFVPDKLLQYINSGNTSGSVNFPNLQLPELLNAHRLIHIHKNLPGILARVNDLLADHLVNITGQYLGTNEKVGYVITDINKTYDKDLIKELRKIEGTINLRVLY
jgi:D-3-phosphoglycerate dehydrogenase / 2-oxoglutarate reductase